jgi:YebC/PmpR family DNA-binding regulatory protein
MSGHSKWATIKHKKGKTDAARGRLFSKLIRELTIAARAGGGDVNANPRLRTVVDEARDANMPMDNIDRAIKKGTGELEGVSFEETMYEGYGPAGVPIMIRVVTDNKNRTTSEIRHIFDKYGGTMGSNNSVAWMFQPKGLIAITRDKADEDTILSIALDAGADDVVTEDDGYTISTSPDAYAAVKKAFQDKGIVWESAEMTRVAANPVTLGEKDAEKVLRLIDQFEEHDDVQQVFGNYAIPPEIEEKLSEKSE